MKHFQQHKAICFVILFKPVLKLNSFKNGTSMFKTIFW